MVGTVGILLSNSGAKSDIFFDATTVYIVNCLNSVMFSYLNLQECKTRMPE